MALSPPLLPTELILQIIEALIPPESLTFLPPHHLVTRTLLSLSLTSRLTHYLAHQLLMTHCIYLNSQTGLEDFSTVPRGCLPECRIQRRTHSRSICLAPFSHRNEVTIHPATRIDILFSMLAVSLRRLEEPDYIHEAWSAWPRLRRLSLTHPSVRDGFVAALHRCPSLTHLVLAHPSVTDPLSPDMADTVSWMGLQRVTIVSPVPGDFWERARRNQRVVQGFDKSFLARLMVTFEDERLNMTAQGDMTHVTIPWGPEHQSDPTPFWVRDRVLNGF
ncbi:hypothetical protein BDV12DRAFT_200901 [Aspergillus spectabilis]